MFLWSDLKTYWPTVVFLFLSFYMHSPSFTNPECQNTKPSPSQGWSRSIRMAWCSDMPGQTPTQSLMQTYSNYLPELHYANLLWETVWLKWVFDCVVKAYWFNFPFSYINNNFDGGNRTKLLPYKFMGKKKKRQKPNQPTNKQTHLPKNKTKQTTTHTHNSHTTQSPSWYQIHATSN